MDRLFHFLAQVVTLETLLQLRVSLTVHGLLSLVVQLGAVFLPLLKLTTSYLLERRLMAQSALYRVLLDFLEPRQLLFVSPH
jgi:hypothetical protein